MTDKQKQTDTEFTHFTPADKRENSKLVKKYEDEIKRGLTVQEIVEEDEDEITEDDYND